MIKLLSYQTDNNKVTLYFEDSEKAELYKFGKDVFTVTTDGITKAAVKEIKQVLIKKGLGANLDHFIGTLFEEYPLQP